MSDVEAMLAKAGVGDMDAASRAVLEAAMRTAINVTHECGTPQGTDSAILDTFREAMASALSEQVRTLTADNAALVDAARNYHEAWKRGTDTLALVSLLRLAREPHPGAALLAKMATLNAERDGYARTAAMVSEAGDSLSVTTAALEVERDALRARVAELDAKLATARDAALEEAVPHAADAAGAWCSGHGTELTCPIMRDVENAIRALKSKPARRFVEAEKVAKLEQALRDMLASADCEWENRKQGHDWAEACQHARDVLSEVKS